MQTVEERRAYIKEYQARNIERIREIRRESARRQRATLYALRPPRIILPKKVVVKKERIQKEPKPLKLKKVKEKKVSRSTDFGWPSKAKETTPTSFYWKERTQEDYTKIQTPIDLCTNCYRKYLLPLGCLFCK